MIRVRAEISHGNYRAAWQGEGDTLADAVRAAVDATPYPVPSDRRAAVADAVTAAILATGRGEHGWAAYAPADPFISTASRLAALRADGHRTCCQ